MVDFGKLLEKGPPKKEADPLIIFERADKESGKEFLRPPQKGVLKEWHENHRSRRDTVVKLHTGQGKTLISLLMLQSYLNEGLGPAIYLCPNRYLVSQTVEQARSFGIPTVGFEEGSSKIPMDFLNSKAILVATCNRMFNGMSVFGVTGSSSEYKDIGAVAMDDAHKCIDVIRDSFSIRIDRKKDKKENELYKGLFAIFQESLKKQAPGTFRDIQTGQESIMAVPFWSWHDKQNEVVKLLQEHKSDEELLFVWNLIKDRLAQSICVISGTRLHITPRLLPVEMIPSFYYAKRRIFLSATLMEDAFLVRDLGVDPVSVSSPLSSNDVRYSGERMILVPTLVDPKIKREEIIAWVTDFASKNGHFGIVSLVPSFRHGDAWFNHGAIKTDVRSLEDSIDQLKERVKNKTAKNIVILANEYDGVDLPDQTCRILCLDSLPSYTALADDYLKEARRNSALMRRKLAQRVEQGLGRAIRGSSDWCIVVVIGNNLTDFISEDSKRRSLSSEAQAQIKIAEELAGAMKAEGGGLKVMERLVNQCLSREEGWKEFYRQRMENIEVNKSNAEYLDRATKEREAEILAQQGQILKATKILDELIASSEPGEKGWYLQLMASYLYPVNPTDAMDKQLKAYSENSMLFRPEKGVTYSKLASSGSPREQLILEWIREFESHNAMIVRLGSIMEDLSFGVPANLFEEGMKELGRVLGFSSQRPDKEIGNGPDNLWGIRNKYYWIISCKNMVEKGRTGISKAEVGQLTGDIAWFNENYSDCEGKPVFIHRVSKLDDNVSMEELPWVITEERLQKLKNSVINFYNSFQMVPRDRISSELIRSKLKDSGLDTDDFPKEHLQRVTKD